jgi:hypothetical protein
VVVISEDNAQGHLGALHAPNIVESSGAWLIARFAVALWGQLTDAHLRRLPQLRDRRPKNGQNAQGEIVLRRNR